MTITESALSPSSVVPTALISPASSEPPILSVGGAAFSPEKLHFSGSGTFSDVLAIFSTGSMVTVEVITPGESRLFHSEFALSAPSLIMSGPLEIAPVNPTPSAHRHRELEWRQTHGEVLQTFAGQWVVLEGQEIIAHGQDPATVADEARARGIRVPYIFYIEAPGDEVAKIGL